MGTIYIDLEQVLREKGVSKEKCYRAERRGSIFAFLRHFFCMFLRHFFCSTCKKMRLGV